MIRFVLILADEMFSKGSFLAYRPAYKELFLVLGIQFVCINGEHNQLQDDEPAIAEITSFANFKNNRQLLLDRGFELLSREEAKEIRLHFLTKNDRKKLSEIVLQN